MKRFMAFSLVIIMALTCSALGERALLNPQAGYDFFMEETDGSEQLLWSLVDMMNDEETIVEADGSVLVTQHIVLIDGSTLTEYMTIETRLFICEYGHVSRMTYYANGELMQDMCLTESRMYELNDDEVAGVYDASVYNDDDFLGTWSNWVFPYYTPLNRQASIKEGDDGHIYMLVVSDDGETLLEYVISQSGMTVEGLNIYSLDENDDYRLWMYTEVIRGENAALPASVLKAMAENETKTAQDKAA